MLKWTKICRTSNCFVCSFFQTQSRAFPCQRVRLTVGPTSREFSHKNVGPMSKNIADFYKFLAILKTFSLPVVKNTHKRTITYTHTDTKKYGTKQSGRVNGSEKTRGKPPDVKINNINKFNVKQNRHAVIEIKCTCSLVSHPPKIDRRFMKSST